MKAILFGLLTLVIFSSAQAQDPYGLPLDDNKTFLEENPGLYDSLFTKLLSGDSLEFKDRVTIYYGVAYQDNYAPYGQGFALTSVNDHLKNEQYDSAAAEGQKVLETTALNLKAMLYTAYAYKMAKDSMASKKYYNMYYSMLAVPYNSGDGASEKSAFVVSSVQDEYLILDEVPGKFSGQALVSKGGSSYDVMTLNTEDGENKLYFNIDQPFGIGLAGMMGGSKPSKKSKKKKKRKKRKNKD